ncbi:MAG: PIN domain-containing protein [Planctomycetes bacterium]|nr:PIN domain-containing protein [Planctomycetota bacterium]
MADYLLDTNIIAYWYDPRCSEHIKVKARVNLARQPDPQTQYVSNFYVSVITLGEIDYGARASHVPDPAKQAEYAAMDAAKIKFVSEQCPEPRAITKDVVEHYGELRAWLFNHCAPKSRKSKKLRAEELVYPMTEQKLAIDENDLWIAAQARTHNLVLVTNDSHGNFGKMLTQFEPTLKVENWAS